MLTSVELRADDTTDDMTLDGDGEPSTALYTLTSPASIGDGVLTFTAPTDAGLAAETSYAVQVVISRANGGANPGATLDVTTSWNEDLALYGWSVGNTRFSRSSDTDPWSSSPTRLVQMRIKGVFHSGPSDDATLAALTLEDASDGSAIALNENCARVAEPTGEDTFQLLRLLVSEPCCYQGSPVPIKVELRWRAG